MTSRKLTNIFPKFSNASNTAVVLYATESRKEILCLYNGVDGKEIVNIEHDEDLISKMVAPAKLFFLNFVLPELVSKRYSSVKNIPSHEHSKSVVPTNINKNYNQYICDCQKPLKKDEIIRCASEQCIFQEFLKSCTKSKKFPSSWMCVYCKKEGAKNKREEAQKRALSANPKKSPLVTEPTAEDVCPGSTLIETNTT